MTKEEFTAKVYDSVAASMSEEEFKAKVRAAVNAEMARHVAEDWTCACGAVTIKGSPTPPKSS